MLECLCQLSCTVKMFLHFDTEIERKLLYSPTTTTTLLFLPLCTCGLSRTSPPHMSLRMSETKHDQLAKT